MLISTARSPFRIVAPTMAAVLGEGKRTALRGGA
jgi:hypothetical protein